MYMPGSRSYRRKVILRLTIISSSNTNYNTNTDTNSDTNTNNNTNEHINNNANNVSGRVASAAGLGAARLAELPAHSDFTVQLA